MSTLFRRRINLKSQNASPIFIAPSPNPSPTPIRHFATAASLLKKYLPKTKTNRTPRTHHALDGLATRLLKHSRLKDSLRVHHIMSKKDFGEDTSTFNPIVKWLTSKWFPDAWLVIRAMRASNVEPDSLTYNYLVRAYLWEEKKTGTNVADQLFLRMREKGMELDGQTNHELVSSVLKTGKVEFAMSMVKRKLGKGEEVLFVTHCAVLQVMMGFRSIRKAVEYVRMVCDTDKAMGGRVFRYLARKLGRKGRKRDAGVVVGEMVKRDLPVDGEKWLRHLALIGERKAT